MYLGNIFGEKNVSFHTVFDKNNNIELNSVFPTERLLPPQQRRPLGRAGTMPSPTLGTAHPPHRTPLPWNVPFHAAQPPRRARRVERSTAGKAGGWGGCTEQSRAELRGGCEAAVAAMTQSVVVQGKGPQRRPAAICRALSCPSPPDPSPVSPLCSGPVREPGGLPLLGPGAAGARRRQQGNGAASRGRRPAHAACFVKLKAALSPEGRPCRV